MPERWWWRRRRGDRAPSAVRLTKDGRGEAVWVTPEQIADASGLTWHRDVEPARWIEEALAPHDIWRSKGLRFCVPDGYPAYVRVLHPAYRKEQGPTWPSVPWADVARWSGHPLNAVSNFESVGIRDDGQTWLSVGGAPAEGNLEDEVAVQMRAVLRDFTATPERCWFALWNGYGGLDLQGVSDVSLVKAPAREHLLFGGQVEQFGPMQPVGPIDQTPQIVWPEDRAWCVVTEIDARSTYIACGEDCARRLLGDDRLETFRATIDDPFDGGPDLRGVRLE